MNALADLLPGTLDLLVLKAVSLGSMHGYGILLSENTGEVRLTLLVFMAPNPNVV